MHDDFVKSLIVFENNDYIIVNKPAGLLAEEDPSNNINVRKLLEGYLQQNQSWKKQSICQLVNRLDKPVGGLMICAKKASILKALQQQFQKRMVKKKYLAIVEGRPKAKSAVLTNYLLKSQSGFKAIASDANNPEAKLAKLRYEVVENKGEYSLLQLDLWTGRFHQIRFQLSHLGHPIWNDAWYGAKKIIEELRIGLFSYSIGFTDPASGSEQTFVSTPDIHQVPWEYFEQCILLKYANTP